LFFQENLKKPFFTTKDTFTTQRTMFSSDNKNFISSIFSFRGKFAILRFFSYGHQLYSELTRLVYISRVLTLPFIASLTSWVGVRGIYSPKLQTSLSQ